MRRLVAVSLCWPFLLAAQDTDHDGLPNSLEKDLLARFAPTFLVSSHDCDVLPATFAPGETAPRAVARDGRIYGQVFPAASAGGHAFIEIHYYHLWNADCGRMAHPLDAEHVSALLEAPERNAKATQWKAVYWWAGAHENTICNTSQGAPAAVVNAERNGAIVWISEGKHASYLSEDACRGGCGGDRCEKGITLGGGEVVNLGEPGAPMNGAVWTAARTWRLEEKMHTDFSPAVLDQLQRSNAVVMLHPSRAPVQSAIAARRYPANAVAIGGEHTGSALDTAYGKVDGSLRRAHRATQNWFRKNKN